MHLAFSLISVSNEKLELCVWNLVWRQIINLPIDYVGNIFSYVKSYKHGDGVNLLAYV
jgi:hypothetical protein